MTYPDEPLPLPHELGPYRLEKPLGRGGMGIVYEAYDHRLERKVAVKRLLRGHDHPKQRARLLREARTTARLDHPSIVQIFDLIEDETGDWIVMERLRGNPLSSLLAAGPLDADTTLGYAKQIARGLAAAHAQGIIHRDLKTENVMILPDDRVKILDFGIAKHVGPTGDGPRQQDLSKTGVIVGTGRAMSPEQVRGLRVGPRSDLFAFGNLLYECSTGISPFRGATPGDTLARIIGHQPQPVEELAPAVPAGLAELIAQLLRKAPELRPTSAEDVERSIDRLIAERSSSTSAPPHSTVDEAPTAAITEPVPRPAFEDTEGAQEAGRPAGPGSLSESAFGVSEPASHPAWWFALAGLAIGAVIVIAAVLRPGADAGPAAAPSTPHPVAEAPLGRYEEAMADLRQLERPGTADRAITVFREMIEEDPGSATAHAGLARAYWEKARNASAGGDAIFLDQALAMAQEAVHLNPYLADGRISLGLVLATLGRYDEAAENLDLAVELEPTHADAHYALGHLAESDSRFDDALRHYRRAGELRPRPLYLNALGALLYDLGRYDKAEQAFLDTLSFAPDNLHALRNLAAIYHAQGRLEEAAAKLQLALKIRPDASLFSNLGTVLFSRGLYSQAAAVFEKALAMDGASNRFIFWLNLADAERQLPGRSAAAERSYRRAIQMLDDLIESRPADVRLRSRRALALARSGELESAREDIDFVRRTGTGGDLYSLFRLAMAEELGGERERALATLSEAMRAGFSFSEVQYEPDLVDLRADPRFHHLLADLERGS